MNVRVPSIIVPVRAWMIATLLMSLLTSQAIADLVPHTAATIVEADFDGSSLTDAAALPDGTFVVTFVRERTPQCCTRDAYFQHISSSGVPLGPATLVTAVESTYSSTPVQVVARPEGGWIITLYAHEVAEGAPDDRDYGAFARAFDAQGEAVTDEFQLNEVKPYWQSSLGIAPLGDGRFVTIWWDAASYSLYARFCDANGPVGSSVLLVAGLATTAQGTFIANAGNGMFTVAWTATDALGVHPYLDTYDSNANLVSRYEVERRPEDGACFQNLATVEDGAVVAGGCGLVRVYEPDGSPLSPPISTSWWNGRVAGDLQGRWTMIDNLNGHRVSVHDTGGNLLQAPLPYFAELYHDDSIWDLRQSVMNEHGSLYTFEVQYGANESSLIQFPAKLVMRRFCERSDPTCDRCQGFDDAIDADGDDLADGCDPCTESFSSVPSTGTAYVSNSDGDEVYFKRTNQVRIDLEMDWPQSFESIPVLTRGMRIRVDDSDGSSIVDAFIPGGAFTRADAGGWKSKAGMLRYQRRGSDNSRGFGRVKIQDLGGGRILVQSRARTQPYPMERSNSSLRVTIALGDQNDAVAGLCSVTNFANADCKAKEITTDWYSLICRR